MSQRDGSPSFKRLDLNKFLVKHPVATFYVRVNGDSMINAGVFPHDLLVVDHAVEANDGDIVIVRVKDELAVKRLSIKGGRIWLLPENSAYKPIEVTEETDFEVGAPCKRMTIRSFTTSS